MKTIFRKPTPQEIPVEQPNKSRFQIILDDLTVAHKRMDHAATMFSTLIVDIEKGMNFVDSFRRDLITAVQEAGGSVDGTASIEEAISDFIPKNLKAAE